MIQLATITMLWELYNYYSMLSFIYHSYYYASLATYYGNKLYRISQVQNVLNMIDDLQNEIEQL